jgi:hypothetical protein
LKKLLTIFLLITLAWQATGYIHHKIDNVSFTQNVEDEKASEGKNEHEYLSYASLAEVELLIKRSFSSYFCKPCLSPPLSQLTPPPDFVYNI